jgi:hypothetical protein
MLKKYLNRLLNFIAVLGLIAIFSCAGMTPFEESLCVKRELAVKYGLPEALKDAPSWMCDVAAERNYSLEDLDDLVLDGTAIAAITTKMDRAKIGTFIDEIENYIDLNVEELTYKALIAWIYKEALTDDDAALLASVVSRRIRIFESDQGIYPFDVWLVKTHLEHQRQQFGLAALVRQFELT